MRRAGFLDQSIGYPLIGPLKEARLRDLLLAGVRVRISVDSLDGLASLKRVFQTTGVRIGALIEVDTGMHRCGVEDPSAVLSLAQAVEEADGIDYLGITCFGGHLASTYDKDAIVGRIREEDRLLSELARRLDDAGLHASIISEGGTIPAAFLDELRTATEIRPGTYIFNDVATVASHAAIWDECALAVLTTVVSRPSRERAIIDAGSKTLGLDGPINGSYGWVVDHPEIRLTRMSEEHGIVQPVDGRSLDLAIGDRLLIIPNHVCPTVNLHDFAALARQGQLVGEVPIEARGLVQ